MNNPFMVGSVVTGESFIGRKKLMAYLTTNYGAPNRIGSFSLYGMPRIGKTSVVYNLFHQPTVVNAPNILTATVDLQRQESYFVMWKNIVRQLRKSAKKKGVEDEDVLEWLDTLAETYDDYEDLSEDLEELFAALKDAGIKSMICIDEFDACRTVFGNDSEEAARYFQFIRTLITNPDYCVTMALISRRSLEYLEIKATGGSVLHLALEKKPMSGFDEADLEEYYEVLARQGIEIDDELRQRLYYYGGNSPFLLSHMGNKLVVMAPERDLDRIYDACSQNFIDYYDCIVNHLKEENYYKQMVQVFVGPKYDVTSTHVKELMNRGYVVTAEKEKLTTLCENFQDYLFEIWEVEGNGEIWPLMMETENRLRGIVDHVMTELLGERWVQVMRDDYEKRAPLNSANRYFVDFGKAERFAERCKQRYGGKQVPFLKLIGLDELTNIIDYYWGGGMAVYFNHEPWKKWRSKLNVIGRARNPIAHGMPEYLTPTEINQVEVYCKEILEVTAKNGAVSNLSVHI